MCSPWPYLIEHHTCRSVLFISTISGFMIAKCWKIHKRIAHIFQMSVNTILTKNSIGLRERSYFFKWYYGFKIFGKRGEIFLLHSSTPFVGTTFVFLQQRKWKWQWQELLRLLLLLSPDSVSTITNNTEESSILPIQKILLLRLPILPRWNKLFYTVLKKTMSIPIERHSSSSCTVIVVSTSTKWQIIIHWTYWGFLCPKAVVAFQYVFCIPWISQQLDVPIEGWEKYIYCNIVHFIWNAIYLKVLKDGFFKNKTHRKGCKIDT